MIYTLLYIILGIALYRFLARAAVARHDEHLVRRILTAAVKGFFLGVGFGLLTYFIIGKVAIMNNPNFADDFAISALSSGQMGNLFTYLILLLGVAIGCIRGWMVYGKK